jgi:hypothetical protein
MLLAAATLGAAGCRGMGMPNWCHPGSIAFQQTAAERFDPFPENEIGPELAGARPRDYQRPIAEPLRARRLPWHRAGG